MPTLTFLVSLPLFLISAGIFCYGLVQEREALKGRMAEVDQKEKDLKANITTGLLNLNK